MLRPNLLYGRPESSGPPSHFFVVHSIDEPHVGNHFGQPGAWNHGGLLVPRSMSGPKFVIHRTMRASAPVAGIPTWRAVCVYRASSSSKSRLTSASSAVRGGVGDANARRLPRKCRRRPRRACSRARPSVPACGRGCCSSATPASTRCAGSTRGSPTRGFRSRRGRWATARTVNLR